MKLRYQFVIRNVGGNTVAIAVGEGSSCFEGIVKLNSSGELLFKLLSRGDITCEELLSQFAAQCGTTVETVTPSVMAFLDQLQRNELLDK